MKKRSLFTFGLTIGLVFQMYAQKEDLFFKGTVYYLLNDMEFAKKNWDTHYSRNPQPDLKRGYEMLIQKNKWEAAKTFNKTIESNYRPRFLEAVVGLALAMNDMQTGDTLDQLERAIRMNPNSPTALTCYGFEQMRLRNYKKAEEAFIKADTHSSEPERRIFLSKYYLEMGIPQKALSLIQGEVEANPQVFYLQVLLSESALAANQLELAGVAADRAVRLQANSDLAQMAQAKVYSREGEWKKARAILEKLRKKAYMLEYSVGLAEASIRLNSGDAETFLYEAFSQQKWNPEINRLFALYFAKKKASNAGNWVKRALLSGCRKEVLEKELPGFSPLQIPLLPFFDIRSLEWVGNDMLAVVGRYKNGDAESLMLVKTDPFGISRVFSYKGKLQKIFVSPKKDRIVFATTAVELEKIFLYYVPITEKKMEPVVISAKPLTFVSIIGSFNEAGNEFYFMDAGFSKLAFDSPFSVPNQMGRRIPIYPNLPFPVFQLKFSPVQINPIKQIKALRSVPIPEIQKFFRVLDSYSFSTEMKQFIQKGEGLDIYSNDYAKILVSRDRKAVLGYYADIKNAFQALVYFPEVNKLFRFDETLFLGKKGYAELTVHWLDTYRKDIYVVTKDKDPELIKFNFQSLLYDKVGTKVLDFYFHERLNQYYVLSEKKKLANYSESVLEIVSLQPYRRQKITFRSDIKQFLHSCPIPDGVLFVTVNGEVIRMEENNTFSFVQFDFEGVPHQISPDRKKIAAYINNTLYLLQWIQ